ncbi:hypothetical protein CDD82_6758 [Ophiocordyceps australis]|uniref:Mediator of RNA polymerase II transcription subunit 18 n=1 Tax=Ophiocordyceps australis TaxID=1399860 RepID=A0A2C5YW03_9HYPO|nr:hypothetical protein CDD82_6758 [Ophiocordyceps australis]
MYELFLTALVEPGDLEAACSVLGGLCSMTPWETISRVVYYQGPSKPNGISNQTSIDKPMRKDTALLWKDLHQNLSRQSYIVQARYDVSKQRDMGPQAMAMDLNNTPGILRWTDFPDPPHGRPLIIQRKFVDLWEQKKLPSVMRDNQYRYKSEVIEHQYRFFREETQFCLMRQYFLGPITNYTPLESRQHQSEPLEKLPSWESLTPVDMQNRWILHVKVHVLQDSKPDQLRKAQDQLTALKAELEGAFELKAIDRKAHDTRVALQPQGVQALPNKVILGKN